MKNNANRFTKKLLLCAAALWIGGCHRSSDAPPTPVKKSVPQNRRAQPSGQLPSGSSQAMHAPILPDPRLTPGDALPVTAQDFCVAGYSKKVRNVPAAVKRQVYAAYGITHHARGEYEVDHLISLELGGSNSIKNLWPESYKTQPWNARVKDTLENELHRRICAGQMDMKTAQRLIATDWIAAYKKYVGTTPRASTRPDSDDADSQAAAASTPDVQTSRAPKLNQFAQPDSSVSPAAPNGNAQVWVNFNSGKYFQPGARYYGKTKRGAYMSEQQAIAQGYHQARG